MPSCFGWCLPDDAWPLLAGLAGLVVLVTFLRIPASTAYRLVGVFCGLLLVAAVLSPREPQSCYTLTDDDIQSLLTSVGILLGLGRIMPVSRPE